MNTNGKTYRYYLKITIIPMVVFVALALIVWNCRINSLKKKQDKTVSEIIHSVLNQQANKDLLLPKIVFINADSSKKTELNEQLINQISETLAKRYLDNDTSKFTDIELKPFFVLPNKPNKDGTYTLTEAQLNELKGHLDFLTKQVDLEVNNAKDEIGKDIDRLNNWVTIWIGVIGFLGIFIPVIINIDTSRNAEKATEKSEEAINKINNAQPKIDKIDGIESRILIAENGIGEIERKANTAKEKSETAEGKANDATGKANNALQRTEKTENILTAVNALGNLKDIDINTLQYITKPITVLIQTLRSIHAGLTNCKNETENAVVKDCLRQLGVRLQILTFFKFINHDNTELINNFSGIVSDNLNNNYNKQNFEKILAELKILSDKLISD